ncbi:MAG: DUF29 domain-containing protein [Bryobacteraceae bacterium]
MKLVASILKSEPGEQHMSTNRALPKERYPSVAYKDDFAAWALSQAEALRTGGPLDLANLAEEIEYLSRHQHNELRSRLRVLTLHILKWQYQPEHRTGSWGSTIVEQQAQIRSILKDSPSLSRMVESYFNDEYSTARRQASLETGLDLSRFPDDASAVHAAVVDVINEETDALDRYRLP